VEELAASTGLPFGVVAPAEYRSPTVTGVRLPDPSRLDGPEVARRLAERGYVVATGYGKLRKESIRIGHMGDHTLEQLEELLAELTEVMST
jgi:aspartate aminotransferase-like enzyme